MDAVPPGYPPQTPPSDPPRSSWRVRVEDALILLAIPVLWFTVVRKFGPMVLVIQIVTLAVMVAVMVIRLRRFWAARRKAEDDARRL